MLLYDSADPAPNPRRVRVFLAEKGIAVPRRDIAIARREQKAPDYLRINPLGQTPSLVLDDGQVLTESVSICRYVEALHPDPPLFGEGAANVAEVDMWTRRAELRLMAPLAAVWMHTHAFTARLPGRFPEYGEAQRERVTAAMAEFDGFLADRDWLDGRHYTIADIVLLTTIDFAAFVGVAMPEGLASLAAWHARASARPSARA